MKRALLYILLLFTLPVIAQKQDQCVFDFTKPLELNPSVTPINGNAQIVNITDKTFANGPIRISFINGSTFTGAQIATFQNDNDPEYYQLKITKSTTIVFTAVDGASLDGIQVSDDSTIGDISVSNSDKNKGDLISKKWEANSVDPIHDISFMNAGHPSLWSKVTVFYTTPSDILKPISVDVPDGSVLSSFNSINLSFASEMSILDATGILLINSDSTKIVKLSASVTGKVINLTVPTTIDYDDTYTITIPAKAFSNSNGYQNSELRYTFKIVVPKNTFKYSQLSLEQGRVDILKTGILLTFPDLVGHVESKELVLKKDGVDNRPVILNKVENNNKQVSINFKNILDDINSTGIYTIEVPEKMVYNAFYGNEKTQRYNPAFTLEYIISNDPPEDTEVMKAAKALLLKSGLGYPKETSAKRIALKNLTEATEIPTDAVLTAAINEFYADTDIVLPTNDLWYNVASINSAGAKLYLYYNNGAVTLIDDAKKATGFKVATQSDGTVSLQTIDGMFLHVLTSEDGKYDATSSKNITATYNAAVNNLTLAKLVVEGVSAEKTFGLFSLYGSLGKDNISQEEKKAFAQVSHQNQKVITGADYELFYTENNTGAFVLAETTKPDVMTTPTELPCSLSPAIATDDKESITITFTSDAAVNLSSDAAAYISDKTGKKVKDAAFTAVNGSTVKFTTPLTGLANGNYTLVMPEGTFYIMKGGSKSLVKAKSLYFGIGKGGSGADGGFDNTFHSFTLLDEPSGEYVQSNVFDNYILYVDTTHLYNEMIPDVNRMVSITSYFDITDTIARGHFEKIQMAIPYSGVKLILDKPIESLNEGTYAVILEEGTFGDKNFGLYLKDRTSISAYECKVNPRMVIGYKVNDDYFTSKPVDLSYNVTTDFRSNKESVVFTMLGEGPVITLASGAKATITDGAGKAVQTAVTAVSGKTNQYAIALTGLAEGRYTVTLPEKTFNVKMTDGRDMYNAQIKASIAIHDFKYTYDKYTVLNHKQTAVLDSDLNNVVLYASKADYSGMVADATKAVALVNKATGDIIRNGKLVPTTIDGKADVYALKVQLDKSIAEGELKQGTFAFIIESGSFGDANYGKYLADNASVLRSDCKLNAKKEIVYNVDNEEIKPTPVALECTVTPTVPVRANQTLTLTITGENAVTLIDGTLAYFTDAQGKKVSGATIKAVSGNAKQFTVAIGSLTPGSYKLVMPKGTFSMNVGGKQKPVKELEKSFSVSEINLTLDYSILNYKGEETKVLDTELNSFIVYVSKEKGIAADAKKTVKLVNMTSGETVRTGIFEAYDAGSDKSALKLKLDKTIAEDDLKLGKFGFVIEAETFGDANFGKLLSAPGSVDPAKCYANNKATIIYNVDNDVVKPKVIALNAELTPSVPVLGNQTMTLTFSGDTIPVLKNANAAYVYDAEGKKVADVVLSPVKDAPGKFTFAIKNMKAGIYKAILPKGTFASTVDGKERIVDEISKAFTVNEIGKSLKYNVFGYKNEDIKILDTELNDFIVYVSKDNHDSLTLAPNKAVRLINMATGDTVRAGMFEKYALEDNNVFAVKLKLDKAIAEDDLKLGKFGFVIEAETFGDANFGKLLSAPGTIDPAACVANAQDTIVYNVDNEFVKPTVISLRTELTPSVPVLNSELMKLAFIGDTIPTLKNADAAYIADNKGNKAAPAVLSSILGKDSLYTFTIRSLAPGHYTLVIPEGSFESTVEGKLRKIAQIENEFTVSDIDSTLQVNLLASEADTVILDSMLNDIKVYLADTVMYIDTAKYAVLVSQATGDTVRTGRFEAALVADSKNAAAKIVFDEPVKYDELKAGIFELRICAGTFGNAAYCKFKTDKYSVDPALCCVNPDTVFVFNVDNELLMPKPVALTANMTQEVPVLGTDEVTIVVGGAEKIVLAEPEMAYLANAEGDTVATVVLHDAGENMLGFTLDSLSAGQYMLMIPEGTIKCVIGGREKPVKELAVQIRVSDFKYVIDMTQLAVLDYKDDETAVYDIALNDFTVYVEIPEYDELVASDKYASLISEADGDTVAVGTFASARIPGKHNVSALIIELDKRIEEGGLKPGKYSFLIEAATFGDSNYGLYLEDKTTVDPAACRVNPFLKITFKVDNALAASIDSIEIGNASGGAVYDLNGRKVNNVSKTGIYIINGKKVMIRKK